jgi:hypothetical protein
MSKSDAIIKLRAHLAELFDARFGGADAARFAKAQGFADGYIQALTDLGEIGRGEILALISEERSAAARRADSTYGVVPAPEPAPDFA